MGGGGGALSGRSKTPHSTRVDSSLGGAGVGGGGGALPGRFKAAHPKSVDSPLKIISWSDSASCSDSGAI